MPTCTYCTDLGNPNHPAAVKTIRAHKDRWLVRTGHEPAAPASQQPFSHIGTVLDAPNIEEPEQGTAEQYEDDPSSPEHVGMFISFVLFIANTHSVLRSTLREDSYFKLVKLYNKWLTREAYDAIRKFVEEFHDIQLPSLRRCDEQLLRESELSPYYIDCCQDNCLAFTGQYADLNECPFCHKARWRLSSKGAVSNKKYLYISLKDRLQHQYSIPARARLLQSYCRPSLKHLLTRFQTSHPTGGQVSIIETSAKVATSRRHGTSLSRSFGTGFK